MQTFPLPNKVMFVMFGIQSRLPSMQRGRKTSHNEKTIQSMETNPGRILESEEEDIKTLIMYQKLV